MKRRILASLLTLVMMLSLLPTMALAEGETPSGSGENVSAQAEAGLSGTGTEDDPYIIDSADDLAKISDNTTAYFKQQRH